MKIAICDDETAMQKLLYHKIKEILPNADFFCFSSGEELLDHGCRPDILFLDIRMAGINGMETAKIFRRKNKEAVIIFITAIEDYVFQAFDVGAFHYLIKPFSDEKLKEVVTNAALQQEKRNKFQEAERYIMISAHGNHIKVQLNDIVYAEVFNRKVTIHKADGKVEYYGRLTDLEKQAGKDFFRPHRAYLIHFKYVISYNSSSIFLKNSTVPIARARFQEFVQNYLKYNQRNKPHFPG